MRCVSTLNVMRTPHWSLHECSRHCYMHLWSQSPKNRFEPFLVLLTSRNLHLWVPSSCPSTVNCRNFKSPLFHDNISRRPHEQTFVWKIFCVLEYSRRGNLSAGSRSCLDTRALSLSIITQPRVVAPFSFSSSLLLATFQILYEDGCMISSYHCSSSCY